MELTDIQNKGYIDNMIYGQFSPMPFGARALKISSLCCVLRFRGWGVAAANCVSGTERHGRTSWETFKWDTFFTNPLVKL